ncbi:hypothetical protein LTR84_003018 [Exophiala bonariae]|uniref:Uncharacterized protein n=1 Tax=Exophiala bonariae TaxID=1690606 RepID=A0AAV9N7W8_9EURO|nr:hypothetical protein LTR84_003018 [Exophiala bonariae]
MKAFTVIAVISTLGVAAAIPVANAMPNSALKERSPDPLVFAAEEAFDKDKRGEAGVAETATYWCYPGLGCRKAD